MTAVEVICPNCGQLAIQTNTKFGVRHDCCGLTSWGGKPLVDKRTREARIKAHAEFDELWKRRIVSRPSAYRMLAEELGVPGKDCHMATMDFVTASRVITAVATIKARLRR